MQEKEVIAIYGGSFNPPLNSHFEIAKKVLEDFTLVKELVFVPVNSKYNKEGLISNEHRYTMLKIISDKLKKVSVSDTELKSNKMPYTIETLEKFKKLYPENKIWYILGSDNLKELHTWYKPEELLLESKIIVVQRDNDNIEKIITNNELLNMYKNNFIKLEIGNVGNISSSYVRYQIKEKHPFKQYMPEEVYNYIKENGLYV